MSAAVDGLSVAASRLDEVLDSARAASAALDGISDTLCDKIHDVRARADDVRSSVVRARDALDQAGA